MDTLAGTVALVTGGASGIGLATARRLAAGGARVVVADIDEDLGQAAATAVGGAFVTLDVTDARAWDTVVDDVVATFGGLDIAHLNAGIATGDNDPLTLSDGAYRRSVAVNLDGVVFGLRSCAPAMITSGGGAIVATASLGGLVPMPLDPVYCAVKHAVVAYVRSVAPLLHPRGVTVNVVCPGFTDTPLVHDELRGIIAGWGVPLMEVDVVAGAVEQIVLGGGTGQAWVCQPGRDPEPFHFGGVPGPRTRPTMQG